MVPAGGAFVAGDALMYCGVYSYWMTYLAKQVGQGPGFGHGDCNMLGAAGSFMISATGLSCKAGLDGMLL
jgi:hypothetical protein